MLILRLQDENKKKTNSENAKNPKIKMTRILFALR